MFLLRSFGSRQSLISLLLLGVYLILHTIEFTQSVASCTAVITSSAIILSSSSLYKGRIWTGTVRGGWMTGTGSSISWMRYFSLGKQPNLSKQSWYSFKMMDLDSWPSCASAAVVFEGMVLTSSKFVDIIPRSWDCRQPRMNGLPGASTMLNLALADLSLKENLQGSCTNIFYLRASISS